MFRVFAAVAALGLLLLPGTTVSADADVQPQVKNTVTKKKARRAVVRRAPRQIYYRPYRYAYPVRPRRPDGYQSRPYEYGYCRHDYGRSRCFRDEDILPYYSPAWGPRPVWSHFPW
jgi:hypothetical protein